VVAAVEVVHAEVRDAFEVEGEEVLEGSLQDAPEEAEVVEEVVEKDRAIDEVDREEIESLC
jgi:hypothetical protein